MDEEAIEKIRETSRNILVTSRRKHRNEEADVRRCMDSGDSAQLTVAEISNKLKTKSAVSVLELEKLKNDIIEDLANIEVVLQTHGALRGLVRELTGHQVNNQCAAAECCCNLALGDARAGLAVAKAAGPYLITALDSLNTDLAVNSAWALGNLAGSGPKACEILIAQGAMTKLFDILKSNNNEIRDAAVHAIVHFAYQLKDDFKTEHLHKVLEIIPQLDVSTSAQLLFILSCHNDFAPNFVTEEFLLKILQGLQYLKERTENVTSSKKTRFENINNMTYLFRVLANLNSEEVFNIVLSYFLSNNMVEFVKKLVETEMVNESVMWFLGNAYKCCSNHEMFERLA